MALVGSLNAPNDFAFKNRIINGSMQVWQRGTTFSNSTTYTADRWFLNRNGGGTGITASRSGTNASNYYLKIQRNASDTGTLAFDLRQVIETLNCYDLAGQTVTISITAYAGANWSAGSFYLGYQYSTAVDDNVNVSGSWTAVPGTLITPTTTPTRYTYTFTVPSNALTLMFRIYGNTYSGTAGADDSIYITNVQLEEGSTATSFDYRPYGTELALCHRYYYQTPNASNGSQLWDVVGMVTSTTNTMVRIPIPVPMRTTPTLALNPVYNTGGGWNINLSSINNYAFSSLPTVNTYNYSTIVSISVSHSAMATTSYCLNGEVYVPTGVATNNIQLSAEL